jgi:16S rRNA (cytosine967-C5)-methyltransferase
VALALAAAELADTGTAGAGPEAWLDLCAGPGGKAALLAALAAQRGAALTAVEISEHRADLVRSALRRTPSSATIDVRTADGRTVGDDEPGRYDRVLVDAPCTGLGALRRRPEARWRRTPADLATLTPLQRQLVDSALAAVRPGGVVAYATCSPHPAETVVAVSDAVRRHGDSVELLDAPATIRAAAGRDVPDLGDGPTAQLWPHLHGTDAMFLALLRRR